MDQLSTWLNEHGLSALEGVLRENDIDIDIVGELSETDLVDLGLSLGQRKRFLKALSAATPANTTVVPASPLAPKTSTTPTVTPPQSANKQHAEKRQLSVLFCDLVGSTSFTEEMELEDLRNMIAKYQSNITQAVENNNGYVARFLGDGMLAYFGYPNAGEDDAIRAVSTGLDIVASIKNLAQSLSFPLRVRVGIATGVVVAGDIVGQGGAEEHQVLGETPNLAARLEGACPENNVLISQATWQMVKDHYNAEPLNNLNLKGVSKTNSAYLVTEAVSGVEHLSEHDVPLVGRSRELDRLVYQWQDTMAGNPQLVLVSGEAGIGKSRLLREFISTIDSDTTVVYLSCAPTRTQTAFYPIILALRSLLKLSAVDPDQQAIDALQECAQLGLSETACAVLLNLLDLPLNENLQTLLPENPVAQRQNTILGFSELISSLAQHSDVLFLVEDMHWMDPSSLESIVKLLDVLQEEKVLVLASARPEFDPKPFRSHTHTAISLQPLNNTETLTLIEHVTKVDQQVINEVLAKTDGIPLYIEEMVKSITETQAERSSTQIPTSLRGSIMARLDRLQEAKDIAQSAAVIGREFTKQLVLLVTAQSEAKIDEHIEALLNAGLIQSLDAVTETFIFKHALVQDVAYDSLLREDRIAVHNSIANTLIEHQPDTALAEPEILAHHFTQAHQHLTAADYYLQAGRAAAAKSANTECLAHLDNGLRELEKVETTPQSEHIELGHHVILSGVYKGTKGIAAPETYEASSKALALCEKLGESEHLTPILATLYSYNLLRGNNDIALGFAQQLRSTTAESRDVTNQMIGHRALGAVSFHRGDLLVAKENLEASLALYDQEIHGKSAFLFGSDHRELATGFYSATLWLLGYQTKSLTVQQEVVDYCTNLGHHHSLAQAQVFLCFVSTLANASSALTTADELVKYTEENNFPMMAGAALCFRGIAEFRTGQHTPGLTDMRKGADLWWATGACNYRPYIEMTIADCLLQNEQVAEGSSYLKSAEDHLNTYQEYWSLPELLRVQAKFALAEGDVEKAEPLYQQAIEKAHELHAMSWLNRAQRSYAEYLVQVNRAEEAITLMSPQTWEKDFLPIELEANEQVLKNF